MAELHEGTGVFSVQLPRNARAPVTPHGGYLCLDFDTFVMDNSGTKKDWKSLTTGCQADGGTCWRLIQRTKRERRGLKNPTPTVPPGLPAGSERIQGYFYRHYVAHAQTQPAD